MSLLDKQQEGVERVGWASVFRAEIDGFSIARERSIRRIPNHRIKAAFPFGFDQRWERRSLFDFLFFVAVTAMQRHAGHCVVQWRSGGGFTQFAGGTLSPENVRKFRLPVEDVDAVAFFLVEQ